jgi:hypothetical protein
MDAREALAKAYAWDKAHAGMAAANLAVSLRIMRQALEEARQESQLWVGQPANYTHTGDSMHG